MQKQNSSNKMNALFYTGFTIVSIPLALICLLIFVTPTFDNKSAEPLPPKIEEPTIERKIIYDTVRVEVPIVKPKAKRNRIDSSNVILPDSSTIKITQDPS